jgi:hypothetical protein
MRARGINRAVFVRFRFESRAAEDDIDILQARRAEKDGVHADQA